MWPLRHTTNAEAHFLQNTTVTQLLSTKTRHQTSSKQASPIENLETKTYWHRQKRRRKENKVTWTLDENLSSACWIPMGAVLLRIFPGHIDQRRALQHTLSWIVELARPQISGVDHFIISLANSPVWTATLTLRFCPPGSLGSQFSKEAQCAD